MVGVAPEAQTREHRIAIVDQAITVAAVFRFVV
jgi:hypothetical protein